MGEGADRVLDVDPIRRFSDVQSTSLVGPSAVQHKESPVGFQNRSQYGSVRGTSWCDFSRARTAPCFHIEDSIVGVHGRGSERRFRLD